MSTKKWLAVLCAGIALSIATEVVVQAQEAPAPGMELDASKVAKKGNGGGMSFLDVMLSGGFMGIVLWLALGACSVAGVALIVDSFMTVKPTRIAPDVLVQSVREAMEQGDVMKALKHCDEHPCPLANILAAGFNNIEEGFEVIQESIAQAASLEGERLIQRVTYLNVVANIAPMLGLLGTVQGMIYAFATLATASGANQQSLLALNIAQALYTTAAGLCSAVPAIGFYFYFRNRATNIILGMEVMTTDLIKSLRNVEVVQE